VTSGGRATRRYKKKTHDEWWTRDCEWVAKKPAKRCKKKSKIRASDACVKTCGPAPPYKDAAWWYAKKPKKDCAWVAKDAETRCAITDKVKAKEACAATCDDACEETTLISGTISLPDGIPFGAHTQYEAYFNSVKQLIADWAGVDFDDVRKGTDEFGSSTFVYTVRVPTPADAETTIAAMNAYTNEELSAINPDLRVEHTGDAGVTETITPTIMPTENSLCQLPLEELPEDFDIAECEDY